MLSFEERKSLEQRLNWLITTRSKYTKLLSASQADQVPQIVEFLNELYEGIRLTKKQLGHLQGIKKRKISMTQALKFRELYKETA